MATLPASEQLLARLTVPAQPASLSAVLGIVRDLSAKQGLTARTVERLAFIAEEACGNIIETAYAGEEGGTFDLIMQTRPGKIVIALEDQGLPFNFRRFENEQGTSLSELLGRLFRGTIRCRSLGQRGNRVEIVHDLPSATPLAHVAEQEIARGSHPEIALDAPVDIRLMMPEDAEGLTRCLYRTYGYTYVDQFMYDPEQILQRQRAGLMHSVVAANDAGEVVGHVALLLEHPADRVGESDEAFVDPRYRGHHLFEKMKTLLCDHARDLDKYGMYGEVVTAHPYSQKGILAVGGRETGVELAILAPGLAFRDIPQAKKQRQSLMLMYVSVAAPPTRSVYLPPAHEAFVRNLYERIGLARHMAAIPDTSEELPAAAQVDVTVDADNNLAVLRVRAAGKDLEELIRFRLRELCQERIDWIALDLPLSDPLVMRFEPWLEGLGFTFAGVLPELVDGDVLRLRYLNNVAFDPELTQVASDFGREVLAYVLKARADVDGDK